MTCTNWVHRFICCNSQLKEPRLNYKSPVMFLLLISIFQHIFAESSMREYETALEAFSEDHLKTLYFNPLLEQMEGYVEHFLRVWNINIFQTKPKEYINQVTFQFQMSIYRCLWISHTLDLDLLFLGKKLGLTILVFMIILEIHELVKDWILLICFKRNPPCMS